MRIRNPHLRPIADYEFAQRENGLRIRFTLDLLPFKNAYMK